MKTYFFKENKTGNETSYETRLDIDQKGDKLVCFFKAKNSKFYSYSNKYNDDLFKGDVVEIFISSKYDNKYYEIEVSPNGTLFYALIDNSKSEDRILYLENNCVDVKVECKNKSYTVLLTIDLAKLELNKKGIIFNAFRIETDGGVPEKHLLALNPTLCGSFHKPEFFIKL